MAQLDEAARRADSADANHDELGDGRATAGHWNCWMQIREFPLPEPACLLTRFSDTEVCVAFKARYLLLDVFSSAIVELGIKRTEPSVPVVAPVTNPHTLLCNAGTHCVLAVRDNRMGWTTAQQVPTRDPVLAAAVDRDNLLLLHPFAISVLERVVAPRMPPPTVSYRPAHRLNLDPKGESCSFIYHSPSRSVALPEAGAVLHQSAALHGATSPPLATAAASPAPEPAWLLLVSGAEIHYLQPIAFALKVADEDWMTHIRTLVQNIPPADGARACVRRVSGAAEVADHSVLQIALGVIDEAIREHVLNVLATIEHPFGKLVLRFVQYFDATFRLPASMATSTGSVVSTPVVSPQLRPAPPPAAPAPADLAAALDAVDVALDPAVAAVAVPHPPRPNVAELYSRASAELTAFSGTPFPFAALSIR